MLFILTKEKLPEKAVLLKRKRFHPGFDNMNVSSAGVWLMVNGNRLIEELSLGTYTPMPAMVFVAKKDGIIAKDAHFLAAINAIIERAIKNCTVYETLFRQVRSNVCRIML